MRLSTFACLAAAAMALRPPLTFGLKTPLVGRDKRTRMLVAQDGWSPVVDETSGQTYYYNEQTGESSWDPPQAATQGSSWVAGIDEASGNTYYYNSQTGESQWEPPADFAQQGAQGGGAQILWRLSGSTFRNSLNELSGVSGFTGVAGFDGAEKSWDYELDPKALPCAQTGLNPRPLRFPLRFPLRARIVDPLTGSPPAPVGV